VRHPDAQQRLTALGFVPIGGTPADYAANLRSETAKWAEVERKANVTLD
jgi:tripartite-type tricarboxylate transporter receptor subunit TctC